MGVFIEGIEPMKREATLIAAKEYGFINFKWYYTTGYIRYVIVSYTYKCINRNVEIDSYSKYWFKIIKKNFVSIQHKLKICQI